MGCGRRKENFAGSEWKNLLAMKRKNLLAMTASVHPDDEKALPEGIVQA